MRRSTAAAVGTLTGAALILGVRLSVQPPDAPVNAAPVAQEQEQTGEPEPEATATKKPGGKKSSAPKEESAPQEEEKKEDGLQAGTYKGKAVTNPYGTVQVTIKVSGGKVSAADATYPTKDFSGTINPNAVKKLSAATLAAQSADVDAVSGATFTSESYVESLQAALDKAGA